MTYQWGSSDVIYDEDGVFLVIVFATYAATSLQLKFDNVRVPVGDATNDPDGTVTLGALKDALESGGFTSVVIRETGTISRLIEEV